jgi:hypothetical protein
MRLYLTSAYQHRVALGVLEEAAARDQHHVHGLAVSPAEADAIVFVENGQGHDPCYDDLLAHPLVKRFPDRVYMYNETDFPYCALPGLYASMPARSFLRSRQIAFSYLFRPNEYVSEIAARGAQRDLLFSFMGARNHRFRRSVLALRDERAHIEDTHAFSIWFPPGPAEAERRRQTFADVMARSKFVLCPRGAGTSSFRLFETMEAGRAPVVLSDLWVEPHGPDWSRFLVRVPEGELSTVPALLRKLEPQAEEFGRLARLEWERWFAPGVVFHHFAECIAQLSQQRDGWAPRGAFSLDREYLRVRLGRASMRPVDGVRALLRRLRARGTA